jgi:polar amino acid transport system substrate-binding protein
VPWAFPNKDGEIIGFEVDVARKLAEDIGVELELVPTAWDGIIPSLIAGKFDVIIGGLTITPARALTVNFTIPYEHSQTLAIVNKQIAPDITTLAQLNSADITFANRRGATTASIAEELFPEAQQLLFDEENASLQELLNGNVQVTLASTPTPSLWAKEYPDVIRVIDEPIRETNEGFAIRKGDPDALAFLNSWITVRSSDGWLDGRFNYWFKGQEWADQVGPDAQ